MAISNQSNPQGLKPETTSGSALTNTSQYVALGSIGQATTATTGTGTSSTLGGSWAYDNNKSSTENRLGRIEKMLEQLLEEKLTLDKLRQ